MLAIRPLNFNKLIMKKYLFSIVLIGLFSSLSGQTSNRPLIAKVNLSSPILGSFATEIEHQLSDRWSGTIAIGSVNPFESIRLPKSDLELNPFGSRPKGWGMSIGAKRYLGNGDLKRGFALKPMVFYSKHFQTQGGGRIPPLLSTEEVFGLGCTGSAQITFWNRLVLEGFAGFGLGRSRTDFNWFGLLFESRTAFQTFVIVPLGLALGVRI